MPNWLGFKIKKMKNRKELPCAYPEEENLLGERSRRYYNGLWKGSHVKGSLLTSSDLFRSY